jgi:glycosyltransferase involved in cell wall biosynthesis
VRILFLSPYVPSRIRIRPYYWIRSLVELGHSVHLVATVPPGDSPDTGQELRRWCSGIETFPLSQARTVANAVSALPRPARPLQLAYSRHQEAERRAGALAASGRFDVVHVEHMRGATLASRVRNVPIVFDAVDSISALFAETARHAPSRVQRWLARLDLQRSRRFEARAPFLFSRVVVTSEREAAAFVGLAGPSARERIQVISNGVDTAYFEPARLDGRRAVLFTGKLSYHANMAAALRLVRRIMPIVWRARPRTPVVIAGKDPPTVVRALAADPRVLVTGYVSDMRGVFAHAAVAVCPLVYGAGVQNKALEALASGVPVILTSSAAEALSGIPGRDYIVADVDDEIARAVVALLEDPVQAAALGASGRAYVTRHHDRRAMCGRLVDTYRAVAGTTRGVACAAAAR